MAHTTDVSIYNLLPLIDEQELLLDDELYAIGRLFVDHNMHARIGVGLLHRHFELGPDELMLRDKLTCSLIDVKVKRDSPIAGVLFLFDGFSFRVLEYAVDAPQVDFNTLFFQDLAKMLLERKLIRRVAVHTLIHPFRTFIESVEEDSRRHVFDEVTSEEISPREVTAWRFKADGGAVKALVALGCARTSSNDHKKK